MSVKIIQGDALAVLLGLPSERGWLLDLMEVSGAEASP